MCNYVVGVCLHLMYSHAFHVMQLLCMFLLNTHAHTHTFTYVRSFMYVGVNAQSVKTWSVFRFRLETSKVYIAYFFNCNSTLLSRKRKPEQAIMFRL